MSVLAHNPIMPGFYPDPSICAVGRDYYLVNSTFSYFPGLPVMHSRDLVHWEQIGNVMNRKSQLQLAGAGHSAGLFAPAIRWHEGIFYVICTNVSYGGTYIVTALNPEGSWSEPYYLEGADGIDPSLFFDGDGKCYYIGTHPNPEGCRYHGDWYIWIQELDLREMKPILTHRHLGKEYPVRYVGHGDLIETPEGEWYMAMLAVRPREGYTTMGRETFLAKVVWEDGWPVVNPGIGTLTEEVEINLPEWDPLKEEGSFTCRDGFRNCVPGSSRRYDFAAMKQLGDEFLFLRNPEEDMYRLAEGAGLYLKCGTVTLKEAGSPSYIGIRQQHHRFEVTACMDTAALGECGKSLNIRDRLKGCGEEDDRRKGMGDIEAARSAGCCKAGLALVQSNEYNLRLEVSGSRAEVILCEKGQDRTVGGAAVESGELKVFLRVNNLEAAVGIREGGSERIIAGDIDIRALSTEVSGGFVGCTAGLYAVKEGKETEKEAREVCFRSFSYTAWEEA